MKDIVWDSEPRTIPNYGVVEKGSELSLPEDKADSFIKQGLAKLKTKPKPNRKSEEAE